VRTLDGDVAIGWWGRRDRLEQVNEQTCRVLVRWLT